MNFVNKYCHLLQYSGNLPSLYRIHGRNIFCRLCEILLIMALTSCSSSQVKYSPIENQQRQWQELVSDYPVNKSSLKSLFKSATLANNWKLMWLIELKFCQIETDTDNKLAACKKAKQLSLVFHENSSLQFDTSLVLFEQFQKHQDLLDARQFATTEKQKIDVLLAQEIIPTTAQQKFIEIGSLQEARLMYLLGRSTKNVVLLKKAEQLFWRHKQTNKQADSLYLLALLQWDISQNNDARSNAVKSLILHTRSKNAAAIKTVQRWLDEH